MTSKYTTKTSKIQPARNNITITQIKQEIEKEWRFFPPFLAPALSMPQVLHNLWHQTIFAYLRNPLPALFKEKLFVYLSRLSSTPYFIVCHSCTLYSLGMTGAEIAQLLHLSLPQTQTDLEADLKILNRHTSPHHNWQPNSTVETSLLRSIAFLFAKPHQAEYIRLVVRQFLGAAKYSHLMALLSYIKACHQWTDNYPEISYKQDSRVKLSLAPLIMEEPSITGLFNQLSSEQAISDPKITVEPALSTLLDDAQRISPNSSKEQLLNGFTDAPLPMMIHVSDGKILQLNRAWVKSTGYNLEQIPTIIAWEKLANVKFQPILCSQTIAQPNKADLSLSQKQTKKIITTRSELSMTNSRGEQRIWDLYSTPLAKLTDGREIMLSIATDITQRIQTETALWQSESKLNLVLEATRIGTWDWDISKQTIEVSAYTEEIFGLETGTFSGNYDAFVQFFHPSERPLLEQSLTQAVETGEELNLRSQILTQNNESKQVQVRGKLLYDELGNIKVFTGILIPQPLSQSTEISLPATSQTDKQAKLDEELASLIEFLPCHIYIINTEDFSLLKGNKAFAQSLNQEPQALVGKTLAECLPFATAQYWQQEHQDIVRTGETYHQEEKLLLPDGEHLFDTIKIPLRHGKKIYAILSISREITDLIETKKALSDRTTELEVANQELESFSYSVSHDLQSPLRVIDGFSKVLLERYDKILDEKGKHYLERIRSNSQRMGELIDDLITLSRVTRVQVRQQTVDLSILAKEIIAELEARHTQRQIQWKIPPQLLANCDPRLIKIVLENLLHNAWKYTSLEENPVIELGSLTQPNGQIAYFVKDNGAGFDMNYQDKLFVAFQRLHSEQEFPGNGIGLATVKRIILKHGGKIWATSKLGEGATFYFTLGN